MLSICERANINLKITQIWYIEYIETGYHVTLLTLCIRYPNLYYKEFLPMAQETGVITGRAIPKTQKMVLDASLLNTQHYKVYIKGKVEQSRGRSNALPYTLVLYLMKREI